MPKPNAVGEPAQAALVGHVAELFRHPVKSMGGESLQQVSIDESGVFGDRRWAVRELGERGQILSAKQVPELMHCRAWYAEEPHAEDTTDALRVRAPGSTKEYRPRSEGAALDAALSSALGRALALVPLRPANDLEHYRIAGRLAPRQLREMLGVEPGEPLPDLTSLPVATLRTLATFVTIPGTYFDAYPLHLVTTSGLASLGARLHDGPPDARRFRPNLVIDTGPSKLDQIENSWCQGTLKFGEHGPWLTVETRTVRCSMVMRAQLELPASRAVLRAISEHSERHFGVYASVTRPGVVRVGDEVRLIPAEVGTSRRLADRLGSLVKRSLFRAVASTRYRG
jgi:uncharacterized protein